jgi:hypothetical protein
VITGPVIIVLEFKVFDSEFTLAGTDQVWDYALDLKNFHESSHARLRANVFNSLFSTICVSSTCADRVATYCGLLRWEAFGGYKFIYIKYAA